MCKPSTERQRAVCFWCVCALAVIVTGTVVFVSVAMTTRHEPDDTMSTASPATAQPSSVPTSSSQPPSWTPTTAPSPSPTAGNGNGTSPQQYESSATSTSLPPLIITLCALAGAAALVMCICAAWKKHQAPGPTHARYAPAARHAQPSPVVVVQTQATDAEAEQRQVDAIRVRLVEKPRPVWHLADVVEDDVDMDDMPEITAVHYGLSPSQTLEGDTFRSAAAADVEYDDDDATLVLGQ